MLSNSEFINKLRLSGLRPTKQRLKICEVLFNEDKTFHFTVNDLAKSISKKLNEKISLATVYNTVHAFTKAGQLKELASQNKIVPRIIFVGGISRPGDKIHLMQIKFIIQVANVLERDEDTRLYLRLIFLPNYSTSKEYLYVPALDVNEQLTIPGK